MGRSYLKALIMFTFKQDDIKYNCSADQCLIIRFLVTATGVLKNLIFYEAKRYSILGIRIGLCAYVICNQMFNTLLFLFVL